MADIRGIRRHVRYKEVTAMSLEKGIEHGKEHRKPYYGVKAIDKTCRNHGSDAWEEENRLIQGIKAEERCKSAEKEELI